MLILFCCALLTRTNLSGQHFTTVKSDDGVEISENGKKVLFYQHRPKSMDGKYERAGYVHPLYSLSEKILTEDFPEDHPYHRGIFWAWHQIMLKDKQIADGWTCENISWEPVKLKIRKKEEFLVLQTDMLWKTGSEDNKSTAILKEHSEIMVHQSTGRYRAIDFDIRLVALVDSLKLGGSDDAKGYGGFCLRLKLPADISFVSGNTAIIPTETAVTAGPWMKFSGSFDNESSLKTSVVVFCNPSNPGSQQQWILRKQASMQNIPYPGRTAIDLTKKRWRLRYRLIIYNDDINNEELEKLFQQYIHTL
ncbi:MAG: DUF6807 family protein [Ferruginibacter sp.]